MNIFLLLLFSIVLDMLNVYLVDVVSGAIVFSMNHRRAKGPVRIVHSENWLVYSFYNEKIRRHEISEYYLCNNHYSVLLRVIDYDDLGFCFASTYFIT